MLSTKIRTTIITLVAATSFAVAAVVPAASQAMTKQEFVQEVAKKTQLSYRETAPLPSQVLEATPVSPVSFR